MGRTGERLTASTRYRQWIRTSLSKEGRITTNMAKPTLFSSNQYRILPQMGSKSRRSLLGWWTQRSVHMATSRYCMLTGWLVLLQGSHTGPWRGSATLLDTPSARDISRSRTSPM
ncbi:hypothetical protein K466DRAFT_223104 [Polyporus arcularius HHB13444]|uniref:Uncharacterized protein n=1 Tax=Polyporus arcularius HHB13444 TaxID=1314778 RepID=A0A5C3PTL2_9APHY|nr:hypothetical protein K466DRAFT_223104 [Polyporus arcularius HHB13444]